VSEPCRHEFRDSKHCVLCGKSFARLLLDERHEWRQTVEQLRADIARVTAERDKLRDVHEVTTESLMESEAELAETKAALETSRKLCSNAASEETSPEDRP
jgi:septal ring factor EnvC (AmiA/AmiB activator)